MVLHGQGEYPSHVQASWVTVQDTATCWLIETPAVQKAVQKAYSGISAKILVAAL